MARPATTLDILKVTKTMIQETIIVIAKNDDLSRYDTQAITQLTKIIDCIDTRVIDVHRYSSSPLHQEEDYIAGVLPLHQK